MSDGHDMEYFFPMEGYRYQGTAVTTPQQCEYQVVPLSHSFNLLLASVVIDAGQSHP